MSFPLSAPSLSSRFSRPALGALLAGAFALTAYMPQAAEACGAPQPGLTSTIPVEGATYPANAALLFSGFDITLDAVTVTVDGAPAQFTAAPFAANWANIAVLVEPAPMPGQTVVVSGKFCEFGDCGPVMLTYTAGAPDLTAPVPVVEAGFLAVYDHADFVSSGGDCQFDVDVTLYVHTMQSEAGPGDAPGVVRATWDGGGGGGGFGDFIFASGPSAVLSVPMTLPSFGGKDPKTEVCVTVTATDTAGNAAAPYEVCPACFFRKDDSAVDGSFIPEPLWTEADAVPGSACAGAGETSGDTGDSADTGVDSTGEDTTDVQTTGDTPTTGESQTSGDVPSTGGETSDQDDGDDKGCACDSDGGSRDLGALVVIALGLGLGRRRRA